ncbi:ADP-ribosylation_factor [Hexamita inflata]|uniref:ADP-ribosylation factor n=1 Tax=Hexamita inflata TaxID=28002 RepID=A0AA86NJ20_9EUKA|nr:ADP-ribosylation factor [Hexamita inflata]CAI9946572.1 ADP-ribosylation factor [Hexamita inflata]CAI9947657.1 ADP-ribosylation factor [Hexamita inflata]
MGSQLSRIFSKLFSKKDISILVLGLDAAGKTTIIFNLNLGKTIVSIPTIGFHVEKAEYKNIKFTIWDVGGSDVIRSLWVHYCQNADAIIYVVDSADPERIQDSKVQLQKLMTEDQLKDAALLVFANKQDLPQTITLSDLSEKLELNNYINHEKHIQACSAKTGQGLYQGLEWLSTILNERLKRTK